MAANWLGVDLGQALTQGQNVLNMQRRGKTQDYVNQEYERQNQSRPLVGQMLGGDQDAATALRESDPEAWIKTRSAMAGYSEGQRRQAQQQLQGMVVGLAAIETTPQAQQQQRYTQFRSIQPAELQKIMPEQYTAEIGQQMMQQARGFSGLVSEADAAAKFENQKELKQLGGRITRQNATHAAGLKTKGEDKKKQLSGAEHSRLINDAIAGIVSKKLPGKVTMLNMFGGDIDKVMANNPELRREVSSAVQQCVASTGGSYNDASNCTNQWVQSNYMRLTNKNTAETQPGQPGPGTDPGSPTDFTRAFNAHKYGQ